MARQEICPGPTDLQGLLEQALSAEHDGRLTEHLGSCRRCQQALEALAAGAGALPPRKRRRPRRWPALEGALRRAVEGLPADCARTEERPAAGGGDPSLGFLTPSADAGSLGRLGHYEVTGVIGQGGMGVVFKAFDPSLCRFVAIKVLAPQLATSGAARQRFAREARAAAAVSHEHVVSIHGVDEANGLPYLVMEYVTGISLQERLDATGPLELKEILRIGMQAAAGLAAAHAQGLVHRDVKPANILLEDGVERVKLTDFGLARAADDASLTQSGVVAGTPQYMAPEQARGEPLSCRADLFSLGSVLYALCTGRPPFRASSTLAVLRRVSEETPRPVRDVNPEIPAWLSDIVARLHARGPADRFQSAAEVADLLRQCLAHVQEPRLVPLPPALPGRSGRRGAWLRRRRVAVPAVVLLAGLGVFGAARYTPVADLVGGLFYKDAVAAPRPVHLFVRLRATLSNPGGPVLGAACTPGGEILALACHDRAVKLVDLATLQERAALKGHTKRVWSVAFSPDGKLIASAAGNWDKPLEPGEVLVWDATTGQQLRSLKGHSGLAFAVAFSHDSRTLASAAWDGTVRLWDPATGREKGVLKGHSGPVRFVAFAPDDRTVATGGFDGTARLWNARTAKELAVLTGRNSCEVNCVAFSPDGKTLATAENPVIQVPGGWCVSPEDWQKCAPGLARLWDLDTRRARAVLRGHRGMVLAVGFSPDGRMVVTGGGKWSQFGETKLYDAQGGKELLTLHGHREWVECVLFAPDGRTLIGGGGTAANPGEVRLWDLGAEADGLFGPTRTEMHRRPANLRSGGKAQAPGTGRSVPLTAPPLQNGAGFVRIGCDNTPARK
jgi:WD40 repeat protein